MDFEKKISHEEVTNKIIDDFVEVSDPKWMQLEADFNPERKCSYH